MLAGHTICRVCNKTCKIKKNGKVSNHGYTVWVGGFSRSSCIGANLPYDLTNEQMAARLESHADYWDRSGYPKAGQSWRRKAAALRAKA